MSIVEQIEKNLSSWSEYLTWHIRYSSLFNLIFYPYWAIMLKEKGKYYPYYIPGTGYIRKGAKVVTSYLDDFIHYHEPERDIYGSYNKNIVERIKYVISNIHYYTNETISNLYFSTKLPDRDYQRLKSAYNQLYITWLAYNLSSGIFIIALNNHLFRKVRSTIPMVFLSSVSAFGMFSLNFKLSRNSFETVFNSTVRRYGYNKYTMKRGANYPRNIDYIYQ